jgi:uncharacterized protein (TIGR02145 family)
MKKNLKILAALLIGVISFAQVGINNVSPNVTLEVTAKKTDGSTSEGIIAPRLTGDALHQAELSSKYGVLQDGAIAYVTAAPSAANTVGQTISIDAKGYYYFDSTENKWLKFRCGCSDDSGTVTGLNCDGATITGSFTSGSSGNATASVPYTGGDGGTYPAESVASTGVLGLTAQRTAGTLATGTGGSITYTITGTPSDSGIASFAISLGGQSCTLKITVNPEVPLPTGSGSLAGKTCFDVVEQNDGGDCGTLVSRASQKANFSLPTTYTQTYTFTPTPTAAVSNVRFSFKNIDGAAVINTISGGNSGTNITGPVVATVTYNTQLNALATGKTRATALTANIIVKYNNSGTGTGGTDQQLTLKVSVQDCACCGAYTALGVYKNFMCQNLGADMTVDPFAPSAAIHGAKYQWGAQTEETGRYISQALDQTYPGIIIGWNTTALPDGTWSDASKTAKDPCPAGYRVPTRAQWQGVIDNNTKTSIGTNWINSPANYSTAIKFGNGLLLPAAGYRLITNGTLGSRGSGGMYQSSTQNTATSAYFFEFNSATVTASNNNGRAYGFSLRCISEE